MDYRNGKCSSCGAVYKVPASFGHNVARCKECKDGVVHFESAGGAPAQKVPAKKVVKSPPKIEAVEVANADAKRKERGTLARLRAERAAAAAAGGAAPADAAAPAEATAQPAKPKAAKAAAKPGRAKAGGRAKPSSRRGSTRSSAGDDDAGAGAGRGRRGSKRGAAKKGSPLIPMLAVLLLGGGGAAAWYFLGGSGDETGDVQAANTDDMAPETVDPIEEAPAVEETPEVAEAAPEEEPEPEPEPVKAAPKVADPDSIDLAALEPFGPARETTDEEWADMNELIVTFLDRDAGAAGNRAGNKLEAYGRKAIPVLINGMLTLDYSTEDGKSNGDVCQKRLTTICNGSNFGWKYELTPEEIYFNKKVVESWHRFWFKGTTSIKAVIGLMKLEEKDPDEAARLTSLYGEGAEAAPDDEPAAAPPADDEDLDID